MALCHVTGIVYLPDGTVAARREVAFYKLPDNVTADYLGAVVPEPVVTRTDNDGAIDVRLITGNYHGYTLDRNGRNRYQFKAAVPEAATADFSDLIVAADPIEPLPAWLQQAIGARDEARAEADRAEAAAAEAALYDGPRFITPLQVLLSENTYDDWPVGTVIRADYTRDVYAVVEGGEPNAHIQNAGGVWLQVMDVGYGVPVTALGTFGDWVSDDTAAIQKAFDIAGDNNVVVFPKGVFKTSAPIIANCAYYGQGSGTVFRPLGGHEVFVVRAGKANKLYAERIGSFVIDFTHISAITSADVGFWLSKGTTPAASSGCNNVQFSNIMVHGGYRGFQMLQSDLGNLWNVSFDNIKIFKNKNWGIYLDTRGSNGSLNVDFNTVTIDGMDETEAKGAYLRGISKLSYSGVATAREGSFGSCLHVLDCTLVDVRLQIEQVKLNSAILGVVAFQNCPDVEIALTAQGCTFNPGPGQSASYIYADSNVRNLIVKSMHSIGEIVSSGTRYKLNCNAGSSSNTRIAAIDQRLVPDDVLASASVKRATFWPDTNYALEKTPTARRVQALDVTVPFGEAASLVSVADYAGRPYQVAGLYLVQGSSATNNTVGFTDLVLVTGVGQSVAQTVVVLSSNNIGSAHARTYSIADGFLKIATAHPTGAYVVSATGFDQAGSAN